MKCDPGWLAAHGEAFRDPVGGAVPTPFGANMGMLRERALEVRGFRTDLGWGKRMIPSEELEFFRRYRALGGRLVYVPAASLVHRIELGRTTREYNLRWWRGYRRASVTAAAIFYLGHRS